MTINFINKCYDWIDEQVRALHAPTKAYLICRWGNYAFELQEINYKFYLYCNGEAICEIDGTQHSLKFISLCLYIKIVFACFLQELKEQIEDS